MSAAIEMRGYFYLDDVRVEGRIVVVRRDLHDNLKAELDRESACSRERFLLSGPIPLRPSQIGDMKQKGALPNAIVGECIV